MEVILTPLRTAVLNGTTRPVEFRVRLLRKLKDTITEMENEIFAALECDLGKSAIESYASEVGLVRSEINHAITHLRKWAKPKRVRTPVFLKPAKSYILYEPKGVVLILGAWNYPFQLTIAPLVAAIAAGNTAVVKPSEVAPATEAVIRKFLAKALPDDVCRCVCGGAEVAKDLTAQKFDHIFFTGSTQTGRLVMKAAAEHLTPMTLELGGKSPCIVDKEVDVNVAAKRIVWGKFYNAGQTCVAPDYVLVHRNIKSTLIAEMQRCISAFYGADPKTSEHFGRIINETHFDRLLNLLSDSKILSGGGHDRSEKYFEPTLIEPADLSAASMIHEVFGPVLPVLEYEHLDEAINIMRSLPAPLACYAFSTDKSFLQKIQSEVSFGGGCFNNTLLHLANPNLPFGGVSASGFGRYHGKAGFTALSNKKSILADSLRFDLSIKYPPYRGGLKLFKLLFR